MPSGLAPADIASAIDTLTAKSQSAQGPASQINVVNIALALTGMGPIPVVIARLSDMVTTCGTSATAITGTPTLTVKADQDSIATSFKTFVQGHQELLSILIGKSSLVPQFVPFIGPPLAAVLRQLESVVDTTAYELIDTCPDVATDLTSQMNSLDKTLSDAITAWSATS